MTRLALGTVELHWDRQAGCGEDTRLSRRSAWVWAPALAPNSDFLLRRLWEDRWWLSRVPATRVRDWRVPLTPSPSPALAGTSIWGRASRGGHILLFSVSLCLLK